METRQIQGHYESDSLTKDTCIYESFLREAGSTFFSN